MPSDNMKVLLLMLLLLLLLCSIQVLTLRCYTCDSDPDCKTETECPDDCQFCMTNSTSSGEMVARTCEKLCNTGYPCCEEDLCDPDSDEM